MRACAGLHVAGLAAAPAKERAGRCPKSRPRRIPSPRGTGLVRASARAARPAAAAGHPWAGALAPQLWR
eukprot:364592-Chlamydomonas_euryale.AAC.7